MMVFVLMVLSALLIAFYFYRKKMCHQYFKKLGIPGPEPNFLFGNARQLWVDDSHLVIHSWAKQFGDIFGYYEGSKPVLVVSSNAAIESVCIKQSSTFNGRMAAPVQPDSDLEPEHPLINMMIAKGERWRKPRSTASRFFSSAKQRTLLPFFEKRIPSLLAVIDAAVGKPLDVKEPFERYAMDSLAEAAFGLHLNLLEPIVVNDVTTLPKDPVFHQAREMMSNCLANTPFAFKVVTVLPEIIPVMKFFLHFVMKYSAGPLSPFICFFKLMTGAIENERFFIKSNQTRTFGCPLQKSSSKDLLGLMMNATQFNDEGEECETKTADSSTPSKCPMNHSSYPHTERYMTEQELKVQLVMFFLSGYETTSISLAFLCAVLAQHPDVQEKLFQEIKRYCPTKSSKVDYDTLMSKMVYLDCVCNELLRLYPVAINAVNRLVSGDTNVCSVPVNQNLTKVLINVWTVHQDPEQWGADPEQFRPERFLPENLTSSQSRSSFLSFGIGPHQCIGKIFSLMEMKIVIVSILRSYKLAKPISFPSDSTHSNEKRIPVRVAIVMTPRNPVKIIFEPRLD